MKVVYSFAVIHCFFPYKWLDQTRDSGFLREIVMTTILTFYHKIPTFNDPREGVF